MGRANVWLTERASAGVDETWDLARIRKTAWDTAFHRGWRAWLSLVSVCFIFSFVGVNNATQTSFVDVVDSALGTSDVMLPHNVEILDHYLENVPFARDVLAHDSQLVQGLLDSATESATWVIRLLALNPAYMERNPKEVWFNVIMAAVIAIILRFCVQNVAVVGQHRYVMESRFSRKVPWRRMLAPFHLSMLANMVWVMVCYHTTLLLWWLTIVGGVYKTYQYAMVPYLLAENPHITWREARRLSARMTDGYKLKMFLCSLSYLHIYLLEVLPLLGLMVTLPLRATLGAEYYFTLRKRLDEDSDLLVERAFDGLAVVWLQEGEAQAAEPTYVLRDLNLDRVHAVRGPIPYPIYDLIYMFFAFCLVGWVWEVGLHFVQAHEWVNRGTLYGPWIPIYGVGGVGVIVLLDRFRDDPVRLFGLIVVVCAALEYATSFILDFMFNSSYWDYTDMLFNVNGRICLAGLLAFGFGGLVGIYIAGPAISRGVAKLPVGVRNAVAVLLVAAFCSDIAYCVVKGFNAGAGVGEEL